MSEPGRQRLNQKPSEIRFVPLWKVPHLIESTASLINSCWKRPTSLRIQHLRESINSIKAAEHWTKALGAAAHFLLVQKETQPSIETQTSNTPVPREGVKHFAVSSDKVEQVVAHGQLKVAVKHRQVGRTCVAFSIIVDPSCRRRGLGGRLLQALENEAKTAGFSFVYLYSAPSLARNFYSKHGYKPCDAMTVRRKVFKGLKTEQLEGLEGVFARAAVKVHSTRKNPISSIGMIQEDPTQLNYVGRNETKINLNTTPHKKGLTKNIWLRKRLTNRYYRAVVLVDSQRIAEAKNIAERHVARNLLSQTCVTAVQSKLYWVGAIHLLPHFKQIGPSCGLCAVAMVAGAVAGKDQFGEDTAVEAKFTLNTMERLRSLYTEAQKRGFTADGEMFDIDALHELACWVLADPAKEYDQPATVTTCRVRTMESITPTELINCLDTRRKVFTGSKQKCIFIVPYDSRPGNCEPCQSKGRCAHYAVVVGVVYPSVARENVDEGNVVWSSSSEYQEETSTQESEAESHTASTRCVVECGITFQDFRNVHVIYQHSASRRPVVARWNDLMDSNAQLETFMQTKVQWIVPHGKPKLKGRCIQVWFESKD